MTTKLHRLYNHSQSCSAAGMPALSQYHQCVFSEVYISRFQSLCLNTVIYTEFS